MGIHYVDDPNLPIRLVRATGPIGVASIERLFRAFDGLHGPHHVHLDLGDAKISDRATMARLEVAVDELEQRQIDVRIVGIDPHHPALPN